MKNTSTPSSFLSRKGFTLIEIMIVITIIGILMAFLAPRLFGVSDGARDLQRKGDLTTLQTAIMKYQQDNGSYPVSPTWCVDATFLANFKDYLQGKSIKDPKKLPSSACTDGYGYKAIGTEGYILVSGAETVGTANTTKTNLESVLSIPISSLSTFDALTNTPVPVNTPKSDLRYIVIGR